MSRFGLRSCVSYTVSQVLVCVIVSITLCVKCLSVILSLLDRIPSVGLCSHCVSSVNLCSSVSYTVCQVFVCDIESPRPYTICWSVFSLCVKC